MHSKSGTLPSRPSLRNRCSSGANGRKAKNENPAATANRSGYRSTKGDLFDDERIPSMPESVKADRVPPEDEAAPAADPQAVCAWCKAPKATADDAAMFDGVRWEAMRQNPMRYGWTPFEEARFLCWQDDACPTVRLAPDEMAGDAELLRARLLEMRVRYDRLACEVRGDRRAWIALRYGASPPTF